MLLLELVEARQRALDREVGGVARVDADDGGRADGARGLGAEAPLEEGQHRLLARGSPLAMKGSRARRSLAIAPSRSVLSSAGGLAGQRAQRAAQVDEAAARGRSCDQMRRGSTPAAASSARVSGRPERMACGPVSHRKPSRRSLRMRPPARASGSMTTTSWPRGDEALGQRAGPRCRRRRLRPSRPQAQPRSRAAASARSASAPMNAGCVPTVRARAKQAMPARSACSL